MSDMVGGQVTQRIDRRRVKNRLEVDGWSKAKGRRQDKSQLMLCDTYCRTGQRCRFVALAVVVLRQLRTNRPAVKGGIAQRFEIALLRCCLVQRHEKGQHIDR